MATQRGGTFQTSPAASHTNYMNTLSKQYRGASGRFSRTPEYKSLMLGSPRVETDQTGMPYEPLTTAPEPIPGNQGVTTGGGNPPKKNPLTRTGPYADIAAQVLSDTSLDNVLGMPKKAFTGGAIKGAQLGYSYGLPIAETAAKVGLGMAMAPPVLVNSMANMITSGVSDHRIQSHLEEMEKQYGPEVTRSAAEEALQMTGQEVTPEKYGGIITEQTRAGNTNPFDEKPLTELDALTNFDKMRKSSTPLGLIKEGVKAGYNKLTGKRTPYEEAKAAISNAQYDIVGDPLDETARYNPYKEGIQDPLNAARQTPTLETALTAGFGPRAGENVGPIAPEIIPPDEQHPLVSDELEGGSSDQPPQPEGEQLPSATDPDMYTGVTDYSFDPSGDHKQSTAEAESGDDTVLCTALIKQGLMARKIWLLNHKYRDIQDERAVKGYQRLARPVANAMLKSKFVTAIMKPIVLAWSKHMAHIVDPKQKGSVFGTFLDMTIKPICRLAGG